MHPSAPFFLCLPLLGILSANAQSGPTLSGSGFSAAPPSVALSPGLVTTFWVAGLNPIPGAPVQAPVPLPTELAGIALTISQSTYGKGFPLPTLPVPIISIAQTNNCPQAPTPFPRGCIMTGITVQVPYELVVDPFTMPPYTALTITQDGVDSPSFNVNTAHDNVHILTCAGLAPCITHADGSLLSAGTLPVAGEILTIYLVGLGATTPLAPDGQPTPIPAPTIPCCFDPFVDLVFGANAGPSAPVMNRPAGQQATVTFAGLSPGQIGLYQINVQLPATFPSIPACGVNGNLTVTSNLAINIGTPYYSHDGLSICVQP